MTPRTPARSLARALGATGVLVAASLALLGRSASPPTAGEASLRRAPRSSAPARARPSGSPAAPGDADGVRSDGHSADHGIVLADDLPTGPGIVVGLVQDARGRPVGGVELELEDLTPRTPLWRSRTRSDEAGRFGWSGLEDRTYWLEVRPPHGSESSFLALKPGAEVQRLTVFPLSRVRGRLVDPIDGVPPTAFEVAFRCAGEHGPHSSVMIRPTAWTPVRSADGRFDVAAPSGSLVVEARSQAGLVFRSEAIEVPRPFGEVLEGVELTRIRGGTLRGLVLDASGAPVVGAQVSCEDDRNGPSPYDVCLASIPDVASAREARTDARGEFVLSDLTAWTYLVEVHHPRHCSAGVRKVEVHEDRVTWLPDLVLEPGAIVSGQVQDPEGAPVGGARVHLVSPWPTTRELYTDADGRFRIPGVPRGRHTLHHSVERFRWVPEPDGLPRFPRHESRSVVIDEDLSPVHLVLGGTR